MSKINIFWFRRDLRLEDNHGLYAALKGELPVLPLFIFDKDILDCLDDPSDPRITFIYDEISRLKSELEANGSSLLVKYSRPEEIFRQILSEFEVNSVFTNHDYEPYAGERDIKVERLLRAHQVSFFSFKDQVIFEKDEIIKGDGTPYTVFTPYARKWKELYGKLPAVHFPSENLKENFLKILPIEMASRELIGFKRSTSIFPNRSIDTHLIGSYDKTRDYPYLTGTSRLGLHLRFGTISIRKLVEMASQLNSVYLNELIWREFYMMILWHFPYVAQGAFKPAYNRIHWKNNESEFEAWCEGMTGYPIVDAGMHELNQTGYMHNRVRMITASFLAKHLLIDWRWGEAYFAKKLLDFELASNNGGWQWAAGTGCDAAPYFRVFSPALQTRKFDPGMEYVRKWIPEYREDHYLKPLVDHSAARNAAINAYKKALSEGFEPSS